MATARETFPTLVRQINQNRWETLSFGDRIWTNVTEEKAVQMLRTGQAQQIDG